jgi:hypothetical protein
MLTAAGSPFTASMLRDIEAGMPTEARITSWVTCCSEGRAARPLRCCGWRSLT